MCMAKMIIITLLIKWFCVSLRDMPRRLWVHYKWPILGVALRIPPT